MIICRYLFLVSLVVSFSLSAVSQYIESEPIMSQKVLKEFVKTHIDYPENELENKIQGTVILAAKIDDKGNLANYQVEKSVSSSIDSAAVKILKLILWNPATYVGIPTEGTYEFAIRYNVKNYKKIVKRRGYNHTPVHNNPIDDSGIIYGLKALDTIPKAILPAGVISLPTYIYSNLVYPDAASKLALSGEVKLSLIIETNGLPSNILALKQLGGGCTEEAIRIVKSIIWIPGVLNSKLVRSKYTISINFKKGDNQDGYIPNQSGSGI